MLVRGSHSHVPIFATSSTRESLYWLLRNSCTSVVWSNTTCLSIRPHRFLFSFSIRSFPIRSVFFFFYSLVFYSLVFIIFSQFYFHFLAHCLSPTFARSLRTCAPVTGSRILRASMLNHLTPSSLLEVFITT
jgi:hypothetical protein